MIPTLKGFTLNMSDREILNHAISMHEVNASLLHSIDNTDMLHTWTKKLYDVYLYQIFESPFKSDKEFKLDFISSYIEKLHNLKDGIK
jgi:hypothetical protein